MDDDNKPDLTLVDTADLIAEVVGRFDASVFVGERFIDGKGGLMKLVPWGAHTMCVGLIERARISILRDATKEYGPDVDDDEIP